MAGRIRLGMIGAGYFARFHLEAWTRIPEVDIVAIHDQEPQAAAKAAAGCGEAVAFDDLAAFFGAGRFDIIDIVTPPTAHLSLLRLAIPAARVVICQKPFCASHEEAAEAAELARAPGACVVVHENFRFQPWYREISRLLKEDVLGTLYQATFRLRPGDGQGEDAYLDRQPYFRTMPALLIRETGIHFIDVFRYLFGEPDAVMADLRRLNPVIAGEDAGVVVFRYDTGFRAVLDGNRLADHPAENRRLTMGEMLVEGSAGSLRLDGDGRLWQRRHGQGAECRLPFRFDNIGFGGDCVHALQAHVVDHLMRGAPLANRAQDYLANLRIEAAIYRSQREKTWIAPLG